VSGWRADDPATLPKALAVFRREVARAEAGGDREISKGVYFLALWIRNLCAERADAATPHVVYHTALDTLGDAGYQHVLRCGLAELARKEGEHAAAAAWLGLCDPAPSILDLDADYRVCLAFLAGYQGDWSRVLELVGARDGEVPYDPPNVATFGALRVAALESLGREVDAEAAMRWLLARPVLSPGFLRGMLRRIPELRPGLRTWARFAPEAAAGVSGAASIFLGTLAISTAGAAAVLTILGVLAWREASASTGMRPVQAQVEEVREELVGSGSGARVRVHVRYRYVVEGKPYTSDGVRAGERWFSFKSTERAAAKSSALRGSTLEAYYDPANPARALLERESSTTAWILLGLGGSSAAATAWLVLLLFRARRRRREALAALTAA
jgi:hypothetical protein